MPPVTNAGKDWVTTSTVSPSRPKRGIAKWSYPKSVCALDPWKPGTDDEWQLSIGAGLALLCTHGHAGSHEKSLHHLQTHWKPAHPPIHSPFLTGMPCFTQIFNMDYDSGLKCLIRAKKSTFEPNYFLVGCLCLLQQFHPSAKLEYFGNSFFTQPTSPTTSKVRSTSSWSTRKSARTQN